MTRRRVAALGDLWDGEMRGFVVSGCPVLVVREGDRVRAYEDRCPHLGVALSGGSLERGVITCPAHRFRFDARTGAGINPRDVALVPVRAEVHDRDIFVEVERE